MQKILCKSTTSSTPVLSTPVNSFAAGFISLGFKTPVKKLTPCSISKPLSTYLFSTSAMPTRTASVSSGGVGFSAYLQRSVHKPAPASVRFSTAAYRTCRCSIDGTNRAWVGGTGTWRALFCSDSTGGLTPVNATAGAVVESEGESDGEDEEEKDNDSTDKVEKPVRMSRRNRSSNGNGEFVGNPDLLKIPGVGLRNQRKLVDNGIGDVAELKKLYKDKFWKASQKMVDYLRSSVGIIHRNHAESITTFIKESVDDELKDSGPEPNVNVKKRLTFCVEGNISVGKSTFLQRIANETVELQDLVEIVPEPVDKWQDVGPDHFNILDAFYSEPQRYAYTFQNYVFVTRLMQEKESASGVKPLRLMERSVFSDRMVFVRAVHEAKWMNEMEISIYDSWFDPVVSSLPGLVPDGFIYLRASPDTCHKRMMLRKRAEEGGVSLKYLQDLHEKHESWLLPFESGNHGVLSVSRPSLHMDNSLHPDIKDRVFYLEGNHMHSSIQKVPALVLDCEPNIDFSKDTEAKKQYARQVAEFFEFVKKKQETSTEKSNSQSPVLLPHQNGGLWMGPAGNHVPGLELPPLDLKSLLTRPSA
ncbi:P-loop containing nucleoside triphosphate hydrolase [Arabidopsis suecica]|uniref:P-loop containing nucleoside triphosphate hydrolase n=1 Tax=Arabidopsis suecica TaxID=45249 RepID=A0A8T2C2R7_ARASU|nr:P-loop containing nucleoside triphosphate hydrolase [Arabidopsis suecica]